MSVATLAAVCLLSGVASTAQAQIYIRDNPGGHYRYFYEQRAYPFNEIPKGALKKARRQMMAQWPQRGTPFGQAVGNGWTAIGPNNVDIFVASSGRLTAIAVHPTTPTTIFAAGAQGGVWKSTNGGGNWTPMTDDQCSLAMGSIVIDQVNPDIIYAGTGELHNSVDSYYGCGVLRSLDGGVNWTQLGAAVFDVTTAFRGGAFISKLVVDRATAGSATATTVFAATNLGLYKSTNSGVDWTLLGGGLPGIFPIMSDLVADTLNPGTLYVAVGGSFSAASPTNGVYKTTNGGTTWTKMAIGASNFNPGRINLGISQSSPNVVYAAIENEPAGTLLGIWKTIDAGGTWSQVFVPGSNSLCGVQCWYDQHITVDPRNPDIMYYGGLYLHKSINGGSTFFQTQGNSEVHVDHHAFAFDPINSAIVYSGNDGGIYKSSNAGASWTPLNTDIQIHQFYSGIALHPTNENKMLGGSQDNGTSEYNGSLSWMAVLGGDGGYTAYDHITGNTAWAETQWGSPSFSGPRRRDGPSGTGFITRTTGINLSEPGQFIPPLVMDPVNPRVLYFGIRSLYQTRNNGDLWTAIGGDITVGSNINAIAVSRADTNTIYVGTTSGRAMVSSNGGVSFTQGSGLPARTITDFAIDPTNAMVAYVTVSGFGTGHVFKTVDRGVSWQNISNNLPDVPVNAIVIQPGVEIDIGTDLGLFKSTDGGATWAPFLGLPNVAVFDLAFNPATRLLVAATHGRGAFKYTVSVVFALRGDVTNDNVVSALDAQAVLSATVGLSLPAAWKATGPNGDANCDGNAPTAVDAQVILSFVVGLPVPTGACVGKYQ